MDNNKLKRIQIQECDNCPLKGKKRDCVAILSSHARFCDWVNPNSYEYRSRGEEIILSLSASPIPVHHTTPQETRDLKPVDTLEEDTKKPDKGRDKLSLEASPVVMFSDEETHSRVLEAARTCPHRLESQSCCAVDRCKPSGLHPGEPIGILVCYPCTIGRLGLEAPASSGTGVA